MSQSQAIGYLLILLGANIIYFLPLFTIAYKSDHQLSWLAFIPLANLWLLCDLGDKPSWWIVCMLLAPPVNLIFLALVWMSIAETTNKSEWWGLLMVFPIINIFVGYYLAFYEPEDVKYIAEK
ncbi:MAG: hypothetical protein HYX78_07875 [Armatimonadetes bacterium]|nr:hypothetical protein [Armatimonadota bacterium]